MILRDASAEDLPSIVAIYNSSIPSRLATADTEPVSVESRHDWFTAHTALTHPLWVAEADGDIAGWLSFQPFYGRPAYRATAELSVYVAPTYQRQGVGSELLDAALYAAPDLKLKTLLAFVFGHNRASLHLFESRAFERWAHLPGIAELDHFERDLVILGRRVEPRAESGSR